MPLGRISFDTNSSRFLKELVNRQITFAQKPTMAYKIVVPDDLRWWYLLEFGTAGRQDAAAPFKSSHSGTYPIDPVNAKMLRIPDAHNPSAPDGSRFLFHVDHPGIRPRLIYRGNRTAILAYAQQAIAGSFQAGISASSVEVTLKDKILPLAIDLMGSSLDTSAPATRVDGKLAGETAGEVWRTEAKIIPA